MTLLDNQDIKYLKEAFEQAPSVHHAGNVLTAMILTVSSQTGKPIAESFQAIQDWLGKDHEALKVPANMLGTLALES